MPRPATRITARSASIVVMRLALLVALVVACGSSKQAPPATGSIEQAKPAPRTTAKASPRVAPVAPVGPVAPKSLDPAKPAKRCAKPNPAKCPAAEPNINGTCSKVGLECMYGDSCCPPLYVCTRHGFEARFVSCPK